MADTFSKNLRKKTFRAKEKLLESFGKADRTVDETFEENAQNFYKQQRIVEKYQRELKNYIQSLKALNAASHGFHDALREMYEADWSGSEHVKAISHSLELLLDELPQKMTSEALEPLNAYCAQFADLKAKIAKRSRKLVDYDSIRHSYESTKLSAKKPDDPKLIKTKEELSEMKKLYDDINRELGEKLPALYDGRYAFCVGHLQTVFGLEGAFHAESSKLLAEVRNHVTPKLNDMSLENRSSKVPSSIEDSSSRSGALANNTGTTASKNSVDDNANDRVKEPTLYPALSAKAPPYRTNETAAVTLASKDAEVTDGKNPFSESGVDNFDNSVTTTAAAANASCTNHASSAAEKTTTPATTPAVVPNVLFKVRATHRYSAEDTDELNFEAGEIILVVPYDDPEDQDEGWLMGIKEGTDEKGVFPVNFTKPV